MPSASVKTIEYFWNGQFSFFDFRSAPDSFELSVDSEEMIDLDEVPEKELKVYKGFLLCICQAASIGGTGTLIGTGSNIVLNAYLEKFVE